MYARPKLMQSFMFDDQNFDSFFTWQFFSSETIPRVHVFRFRIKRMSELMSVCFCYGENHREQTMFLHFCFCLVWLMIVREDRCGSSNDDAMFKFLNWICFPVLSVLVNKITNQIKPRQN